MADKPIRIGIIGAGGIVRSRHMPGLAKIDGVSVAAVCNRRRSTAEQFAQDFGVADVHDRWREVVERTDLDVIWIGTTPYLHRELTEAALAAGKHVFCQARMAMNLAEAKAMAAAADAHPDCVTMICPPPMGMPGDRVMRRLLHDENFAGEIRHVRLWNLSAGCLDADAEMTWRLDKRQSGLNAFAFGIYIEVLNRWIGPARRVTAVLRQFTERRRDPQSDKMIPVEIPESLNLIADLAGGGVGVYEFNGVSAHAPSDRLEIYGTRGTIHYLFDPSGNERILAGRPDEKALADVPISPAERHEWTVEADFIHAVRTGDTSAVEPNFHHGLQYMAFIEATYQSAQSGRTADIERI